jgi:hypothetical protein
VNPINHELGITNENENDYYNDVIIVKPIAPGIDEEYIR